MLKQNCECKNAKMKNLRFADAESIIEAWLFECSKCGTTHTFPFSIAKAATRLDARFGVLQAVELELQLLKKDV